MTAPKLPMRSTAQCACPSCSNFPKCRAAMDLPPELNALGEQAMAQWVEIDGKNKLDLVVFLKTQAEMEPAEAETAEV